MARSAIRWMRVSVSGCEENSFWTAPAWEPELPATFYSFSNDLAMPQGFLPQALRNS